MANRRHFRIHRRNQQMPHFLRVLEAVAALLLLLPWGATQAPLRKSRRRHSPQHRIEVLLRVGAALWLGAVQVQVQQP